MKKAVNLIVNNFLFLLVAWSVILIANQIFIFNACFKPYCIAAALPHTFVLALILTFIVKSSEDSNASTNERLAQNSLSNSEAVNTPICPNCGDTMILKTARHGIYAGQRFWGCQNYPRCNGIINIRQ
ncbi:topoisomerase DNA-binding C4 zinc finger domain-containing protein [Magnetovirga frankeli]|uniref:topoisomerase DNA-binding C4 zinc finger domain-containing protein n=1 Tax=Magnetovirga frankeli TaxID=947516 RepID=UPI003D334CEF